MLPATKCTSCSFHHCEGYNYARAQDTQRKFVCHAHSATGFVQFTVVFWHTIDASCTAWRCERKLGSPQRDRCNIFVCPRTYTTSVLLTTTKRRRQRGGLDCRTYNFCSLLPFQVPSEWTTRKRGKQTWKRSMLQYVVCWCSNTA